MKRKYLAAAALLAALALNPAMNSFAASGWTSENGNWVYYDNSGNRHKGWIQTKDGLLLYGSLRAAFMLKGFQKIDGKWYYFSSDGLMQTGWIKDEGKWYYCLEDGVLVQENWLKVGDNYFFMRGTGELAVGWRNMNNSWYYFKAGRTLRVQVDEDRQRLVLDGHGRQNEDRLAAD